MVRGLLLMLTTLLVLAGCAQGPRVVSVSMPELTARLARDFPLDRRWLEVFDVRVSEPRLSPETASNRMRADFRIQAQDRLSGRKLDARVAAIAGLRWEPSDRTLRLERVDLDLPDRDDQPSTTEARAGTELVRRLGLVLAGRLLEDQVVWRAPADQALVVQRVTVTSSGLELAVSR
jgi:hypothetical protein